MHWRQRTNAYAQRDDTVIGRLFNALMQFQRDRWAERFRKARKQATGEER